MFCRWFCIRIAKRPHRRLLLSSRSSLPPAAEPCIMAYAPHSSQRKKHHHDGSRGAGGRAAQRKLHNRPRLCCLSQQKTTSSQAREVIGTRACFCFQRALFPHSSYKNFVATPKKGYRVVDDAYLALRRTSKRRAL